MLVSLSLSWVDKICFQGHWNVHKENQVAPSRQQEGKRYTQQCLYPIHNLITPWLTNCTCYQSMARQMLFYSPKAQSSALSFYNSLTLFFWDHGSPTVDLNSQWLDRYCFTHPRLICCCFLIPRPRNLFYDLMAHQLVLLIHCSPAWFISPLLTTLSMSMGLPSMFY